VRRWLNIARGQVIDEEALIASLCAGHVGFAALVVAGVEPLPAEAPCWTCRTRRSRPIRPAR
jgi:phosphoglycerate dehydrogenase-like enzyme